MNGDIGQRARLQRGRKRIVLAGTESDRRLDQISEAAQRVSAAGRALDHRCESFGDALVDDRSGQFPLGGKSAVQRPFTDAGPAGDGVHGRVRTQFGVDLARGTQDALGVARGIGA